MDGDGRDIYAFENDASVEKLNEKRDSICFKGNSVKTCVHVCARDYVM